MYKYPPTSTFFFLSINNCNGKSSKVFLGEPWSYGTERQGQRVPWGGLRQACDSGLARNETQREKWTPPELTIHFPSHLWKTEDAYAY